MSKSLQIGIAWFDRDQWQRLAEVVPDRNELDETFEEWERSARKAIKNFERNGQSIVKVPINVDELVTWCTLRGKVPNGESRAAYVSDILKQQDKQKS